MFVDGEAFLVSRTEPLLVRLCYYIPSKKASDIVKCLVTMVKFYKASGYTIIKICCDKERGVNKAIVLFGFVQRLLAILYPRSNCIVTV